MRRSAVVKHASADGERGFALIFALILLILGLSVAAVIALNLGLASRNLTRRAELVHTTALLDAGMALALAELHADSSWSGGRLDLESGVIIVSARSETDLRFRRVELEAQYRRKVQRAAARVAIPPGLDPPVVMAWAPYAEALGSDPLPPLSSVTGTGGGVTNPFNRP